MQENINIPDSTITTNLSFRNLVLMNMQQLTNFPYIEKDFDALTDYELLCLVVKFLNDVIANQNEQNDSITRMYESFLALQDYVNNTKDELEDAFNNLDDYVRNYFDNLDVQEEINNKLDQMLEDGVLEQIIEQFIKSTALWCFDNVNDMKSATNLIDGSYAKTLGYYDVNDGGQGTYIIIDDDTLVDDGGSVHVLNNGLRAKLIVENNTINPIMFGCKGDNSTDDSLHFYKCLKAFNNINIDLLNKEYNLTTLTDFTFNKNTSIKNGIIHIDDILMRNAEGLLQLENLEIKAKSLTDVNPRSKFIIFGETGDTGSFLINNCKIIAESSENYDNKICLIYLKDYIDCTIRNSYLYNKHVNTTAGGCIWLGSTSVTRNNVIIENNILANDSRDEIIGLYDHARGNLTEIRNNTTYQTYPGATYANTLYYKASKTTNIVNNTFNSCSTGFGIYNNNSDSYNINFNNNTFNHDASSQNENNKSGLFIDSSVSANINNNTFNAYNCSSANYNIIPFNATGKIVKNWDINYDSNTTNNAIGSSAKKINCNYEQLYSIQGVLENCVINTDLGRMSDNIKATNTTFNMTNGTHGYATGETYFKNCSGGEFANSGKLTSLKIENSSVNFSYGDIGTYVISTTRLGYACDSGHIYNSIMDNAIVENITKS